MRSAREYALRVLHRVEADEAYADEVLDHIRGTGDLSPQDGALLQELSTGVLRWRGRLDWVLGQFLKGDLEDLTPWIRNILRLGAYQLLCTDRIPDSAAVDECVKLSKRYGHKGTAGLVNGVLRNLARQRDHLRYPDAKTDPAAFLSVCGSHPEWMVRRWLDRYGLEETTQLCAANNRQPGVTVRANSLRGSLEDLIGRLGQAGLSARPHPYAPGYAQVDRPQGLFDTAVFDQGRFQVQDASGALAVQLLDPQPGERVLDMCAAPGGKTTHIAERMEDRGQVLAVDVHRTRLARLRENAERLGLHIITTVEADGRHFADEGLFDRVLVDVPCSGLGVLGRRADARWRKREDDLQALAQLQYDLLRNAAARTRAAGVLVYSTCSIEPEENEELVERFLRGSAGEFVLESPSLVPARFMSGRWVRSLPHHDQMDGAFAARLRRKS